MAAPQSPIGSRRRLGAELRRLRTKAELTLDEVAERMTCSTSKISRLETGKGVPKVPDVSELMRIYDVRSDTERDMLLRLVHDGRQQGWWEPYVDGVAPERYVMDAPSRYTSLETEATTVSVFEITWMHGLLQSADYARALLRNTLGDRRAPDEIEKLVDLRMRRQQALLHGRPPLQLKVVLDESVLARTVGGSDLMADALAHVRDRAALPSVELRVLPLAAGAYRAQMGPIVLLQFPRGAGTDVVYLEGHGGETLLEAPKDVVLYKSVLDEVWSGALPAVASEDLVRAYQHEHAARGRTTP